MWSYAQFLEVLEALNDLNFLPCKSVAIRLGDINKRGWQSPCNQYMLFKGRSLIIPDNDN